jgi:hypothetical protein
MYKEMSVIQVNRRWTRIELLDKTGHGQGGGEAQGVADHKYIHLCILHREGVLHDKDGGLVLTGNYVDDKLDGIAHILSGSDGSFLEVNHGFKEKDMGSMLLFKKHFC